MYEQVMWGIINSAWEGKKKRRSVKATLGMRHLSGIQIPDKRRIRTLLAQGIITTKAQWHPPKKMYGGNSGVRTFENWLVHKRSKNIDKKLPSTFSGLLKLIKSL